MYCLQIVGTGTRCTCLSETSDTTTAPLTSVTSDIGDVATNGIVSFARHVVRAAPALTICADGIVDHGSTR